MSILTWVDLIVYGVSLGFILKNHSLGWITNCLLCVPLSSYTLTGTWFAINIV